MTKEDLNYIKDTLDWIHENTDLKNHEEGIETYANLMMNCENVIAEELALFSVSKSFDSLIDRLEKVSNIKYPNRPYTPEFRKSVEITWKGKEKELLIKVKNLEKEVNV